MKRTISTAVIAGLLLAVSPSAAPAETGQSSRAAAPAQGDVGFHLYANIGETWGHASSGARVDGSRYLALLPLGVDAYLGRRWRLSVNAESLVGLIIPSLVGELAVEYAPLGMARHGPLFRLGARGVYVTPAIFCINEASSCRNERDQLETEPPDGIGPALQGGFGTLGAGYQLAFDHISLYGMAAYQGGYLQPTPASREDEPSPLATYYHGYLITLGVHAF